jgi:regulator of sigma E protease
MLDNVRNVRLSLQMLFTGRASVKDMAGPVGIVGMMTDVATESKTTKIALLNLLSFGGMIAVNLAIMNLLPIPALDGGRIFGLLVTTAIEAVTKKKLDPKYEGYIHAAGMVLLLIFMALVLFKDIFMIFKR